MAEMAPVYSLVFTADNESQVRIIHRWMMEQPAIIDFITPIPLNFIFKSFYNSTNISKLMDFMFPNGSYLISRLNLTDLDGKNPDVVWQWIYDRNESLGNKFKNELIT